MTATFNPLPNDIHEKPSLLERLRQNQVLEVANKEELRQRRKLAIEHQSEFPARIRGVIRDASAEEEFERQPWLFLEVVYDAAKAFFFGRSPFLDDDDDDDDDDGNDGNGNGEGNEEEENDESEPPFHWWHGMDKDIDTEDQVETAIRFFPSILTEKYHHPSFRQRGRRAHFPIFVSLYCSKSMFFIPLLAQLGEELGQFTEAGRGGLACHTSSVFAQLICNIVIRDDLDEESSGQLDEASTAILMRLKEKGLMNKTDIRDHDLVLQLLYNAMYKLNLRIEKRFRFLIDWDPSILMECGRGDASLINHYLRVLCKNYEGDIPPGAVQRLRIILELGMSHYPKELGFLYHGAASYHGTAYGSPYNRACDMLGTRDVSRIVDNEILGALVRNNNSENRSDALRSLVFEAATNTKISLDGLYTLIRYDPIALLAPTLAAKKQ